MQQLVRNHFRRHPVAWSGADKAEFSASDVRALHRSLPEYRPTPLLRLPGLARRLGVGEILVKAEAHRFGLKAFKALGATYAIYRFLCTQVNDESIPADRFYLERRVAPGRFTFCTATDGNHGRGVAWAAAKLNQKAVVFMPAGSADARVAAIRQEGAEAIVIDGDYDEAVRRAAAAAETHGWQVISDTSWEGYEEIPRWIAAGYSTLFNEIDEALGPSERIDAVLVPSGVGAMAAAAAWHFRGMHSDDQVRLISVEPCAAACLLESARTLDGRAVTGRGKLDSIMAGLNCGTPSRIAWPVVRDSYDAFLAVDDRTAVRAVRTYYYPEAGDPQVISGESGAATLAGLLALTGPDTPSETRRMLALGSLSNVLLLNTEGATDPAGFRRMVETD